MSNLVLITSEFPYYSGEPFLSNELPFLSLSFDEIYIFSINGYENDIPTRGIPTNAKCFPLGNTSSIAKYTKYILRGVIEQNNELKITEKNLKRIAASLYTRGRATAISNQIYNVIVNHKLKIDNATIYSFWFAYQSIAAWLLSKKLNSKGHNTFAISRAHGYDLYWERAVGGYLPFQDVSLRNLKWCFPCSDYGTEYLLNKYPWASDKVKTSRLGTKDYGINPYHGEKTFVTCCNLEPLKRMSLFAEAFCDIAKDDKGIRWICIGSGEEEAIVRRMVENANMFDQVTMMGRLSNEKVMEIYRDEGVMFFCNVSTSEGLPVSIMEAMSFGIPIIATDVGGTKELVNDDNGFLVDPNLNPIKLATYLRKALRLNCKRYLIMREKSRKHWLEIASASRNYSEFCKLIH